MKKQILKIAGVKSEKEFYKKFPTEEAFMAKHGKEFKKAQIGTYMTSGSAPAPFQPLDVQGMQSDINYAVTGMTDAERRQLAALQAQQANQMQQDNQSQGGSDQMMQMLSALAESGAAKKGKNIPKAQGGIGYPTGPQLTPAAGQQPTLQYQPSANAPAYIPNMAGATTNKPVNWAKGIPILGKIVGGIQKSKEAKNLLKQTLQQEQLTGAFAQAAMSRPVQQPRRQYVRPEDVVLQPQQMFPSYGVGTNVLAQDGAMIGGNPTEIQNMYNPGTLYTDLGYEPLNDTSKVKNYKKGGNLKRAQTGFETFMNQQGGNEIFGTVDQLGAFNDGGGDIGSGIGEAIGSVVPIPGAKPILTAAGRIIGSALDQKQEKTEASQKRGSQNVSNIVGQSAAMAIQNQFGLKEGGELSPYKWVSHTWQPQVITTFGEHKLKDLLKPPHDADMLRAGGHLKEYTPPSARAMSTERPAMQMGGELQTHWGGYAEPMSYNPYLPEGGETIMFRGQSHDESDGKGNTGIGITYGDNPVEVERGEPAVKLQDGTSGESNLTVFGNIKITNAFADMLADPKAKGKKFKTYVADLSKQENKQNKLIDKSIEQLDSLNVQSSFDKLTLGTLQANMEGANAKLKDLADKKMNAAALQNAINDTKEEELVKVTDDGKVLAQKGASIPKAQTGRSMSARSALRNVDPKIYNLLELLSKKGYNVQATSGMRPGSQTAGGRESRHASGQAMDVVFPDLQGGAYDAILKDPEIASYLLQNDITAINEYDPTVQEKTGATGPHIHFGFDKGTPLADDFRKKASSLYPTITMGGADRNFQNVSDITNYYKQFGYKGGQNIGELQKWIIEEAKKNPAVANELTSYLRSVPLTNKGKRLYGPGASPVSLDADRLYEQFNDNLWEYRFPKLSSLAITKGATDDGLKTVELGKKDEVIQPKGFSFTMPAPKTSPLLAGLKDVLPNLLRRRIEPLDPNQLLGEMFALSQNQLEPVPAQKFFPELGVPMDISLQDILNENQATYNATQRQVGYNPAALASLNAQKYLANQKVLGEQFRLNQAEKQRVYSENRNLLNQARLQNLQILDTQAQRQALALSKTKATTQEALNSISSKYAQNLNRQRQYAVMENMFNYRFTPGFRTINVNPTPTFDLPVVPGLTASYDNQGNVIYSSFGNPEAPNPYTSGSEKKTKSAKRGINIAKAIKNL